MVWCFITQNYLSSSLEEEYTSLPMDSVLAMWLASANGMWMEIICLSPTGRNFKSQHVILHILFFLCPESHHYAIYGLGYTPESQDVDHMEQNLTWFMMDMLHEQN